MVYIGIVSANISSGRRFESKTQKGDSKSRPSNDPFGKQPAPHQGTWKAPPLDRWPTSVNVLLAALLV
jgi:hypothetical protein